MAAESSFASAGSEVVKPARVALGVVALCFLFALIGRGVAETFTVFLLPISRTFGWARADVVSVYSLGALSMGLASPFVGRLFDLSGPRTVYGVGLLFVGAGLSLAAFADRLWQFQFCIGLMVGLGSACLGNVTASLLLGRWFGPRLPTAMAVVYSAMGAGVLTMLPLTQLLIEGFQWRGAYHLLGATCLVAIVPVLLLPWRRLAAGTVKSESVATLDLLNDGWTLITAMRHHAFWALFCTFFFTAVSTFAISVQVVAYLIESGFSPLQAATAWGFSGVILVAGMLTVSWLDSLIGRRPAIMISYGLTTVGIGFLWLLHRYPNYGVLVGFLLCFGSTMGSRGPLITAVAMNIYRGKHVGTIFGTISIGTGLGSALGSLLGGFLHDWAHSYDPVLALAVVCAWLGMIPFLAVRALR